MTIYPFKTASTWTFDLNNNSLFVSQNTDITDNCSISPTQYFSSNTWVATVSWSMITAVWSWTAVITPNWGLCWNNPWKTLTISDLVWTSHRFY